MKKRILACILAVAMVFTLLPMQIFAADDTLVISDCDSLDGWTKEGGGMAISVATTNAYNSAAGIRCDVMYGKFGISYTPAAALDISNYKYIEWDTRFFTGANNGLTGTLWEQVKEQYGTTGNNKLLLRLISEGGNRVYFLSRLETTVSTSNPEWVHFRATVSDYNTENGTFDPSALTGFFFNTVDSNYVSTVSNGVIAMDNLIASGYQAPTQEPDEDPDEDPVEGPVVLSDCEDTTGWTYGGAAGNFTTSTSGKDGASLYAFAGYGALRKLTFTPAAPVKLTGLTAIEWDMAALADKELTDQFEAVMSAYSANIGVEISDGTNTVKYGASDLETEAVDGVWWHVSVPLDSSKLNLANITSFAFYVNVDGALVTELPNVIYKIDNLKATGDTVDPSDPVTPPSGDEDTDDVLLTDCDSLDGWTNTGGNAFKLGDESLGWGGLSDTYIYRHVNYGAFRQSYYKPSEAVDLTDYKSIKWKMYFGPVGLWESIQESYASTIYVKLFNTDDDAGARMLFALDKIISSPVEGAPGWYEFAINLDDNTASHSFDKTNLTRISFVTIEGGNLDEGIGEGVIGFDDIYLSAKTATAPPAEGTGWPLVSTTVDKTISGNTFVYENSSFSYDLSQCSKDGLWLLMKVYVENQTNPDDLSNFISDGQLELTSSGGSDVEEASWTVDKLGLRSGWTSLRLKLSEAHFDNGLSLSSINYLRLYIKPGNTDTYRIKVQDVSITNEEENSPLPSIFSDGMMFQQNKTMNLWGQVDSDSDVSVELYKAGTLIETANTKSDIDGNWEVKLPARKGSYDVYSITVKVNGEVAKEIIDIMIGELWISAGQSNMEFFLGQTIPGYDWSLIPLDKYVRVFVEPTVPGGVTGTLPVKPAYDIEGAYWTNGGAAANVKYVSAIAYYTCLQLREELGVPVGFINAAKGASVIEAWLSRESIDNNAKVKQTLTDRRVYKTEATYKVPGNWNSMTALYNTKLAPLAGFNIAGVMWYQGESNVKYAEDNGENLFYEEALRTLAEDWAGLFGFEKGEMPFLYAHIAPYNYSTVRTKDYDTINAMLSESMSKVWASYPDSMVQIPIYDVSLVYKNPPDSNYDPIHPSTKKPVAERFANAMLSRFYSVGAAGYNAAVYKSMSVVGNKIYITMDQVGTGLSLRDNNVDLDGFTICGSDRVFVNAYAKIIGKDTIEVYSPLVSKPVAAAYAFSSFNMNANLINSYGLPAVPFRTDNVDSTFVGDNDWMNADYSQIWVDTRSGNTADFANTWEAYNTSAAISFDTANKSQGNSSLKIVTSAANSGAGPILKHATMIYRMASYKYVSVMVKNPDNVDKTLKLKVGTKYATALDGSAGITVPKNSDFTQYVFDLSGIVASAFNAYTDYDFIVAEAGTVYIDDIRLGTEAPIDTAIVETELKTTVASFLAANGLASTTTVYRGTAVLANTDYIGTDCYASSATRIVYAKVRFDLDGDGICRANDLSMLRKHLLGAEELKGLAFEAAKRFDDQTTVNIVDLVRMKKKVSD